MSNLKQFTSRIENPSTGEIILGTQSDKVFYVSEGYLECDGSILLQSAYPALFLSVGLITTNTYNTSTEFILPTVNTAITQSQELTAYIKT